VRKLDAIFFDIDDTLYSTTEFARQARENSIDAMIRLGLGITREDALRELEEVISEFSSNYDRHYDKLLCRLPAEVQGDANWAVLVAAGMVAYHDTKFRQLRPFSDAEEMLSFLKDETELILGVITEGLSVKQAEKLVRLGVYRYLDPRAIFISDQVGISKPNPKLYRHALDRLGLAAERTMYVGDNPVNDVEPAKRTGMITVRYRGRGKHSGAPAPVEPDYEIREYGELLRILADDFDIRNQGGTTPVRPNGPSPGESE
jgi:putative hydrolase of the HAD superfamily